MWWTVYRMPMGFVKATFAIALDEDCAAEEIEKPEDGRRTVGNGSGVPSARFSRPAVR